MLATASPPERQHLNLLACRHGTMLFPRGDMFIGRSLELYGEWSEGEVTLFSNLLAAGDQVVEAGANIGTHTLALARLVGPTGRIWALEPQKLVFQMLCANLGLNEIENVEPLHAAAGAIQDTTLIPRVSYAATANFGGVATGGSGGDRVRVMTVDELALPHCKLIKVDVEGHELDVLRGAAQTIQRLRPCLFVEDDRADQHGPLMGFMREQGYRAWWHCAPLFSPENFRRNPVNAFGSVFSVNLLCLPQETAGAVVLPLPEAPWDGRHIFAH